MAKKQRGRPPIRVLICGSREWTDDDAIMAQIFKLPDKSVIIHGACDGADMIADRLGRYLLYDVIPFPVLPDEWERYGKRAGPMRNARMLKRGKPDQVWAFTHILDGGTANMVNQARQAGIEVKIFGYEEPRQISFFDTKRETGNGSRMRRIKL